MREGRKWATQRGKQYLARGVFKWRVLGLHLSDLDKILYRHTLGDEERSCVSPMSVIIMGAEICWRTGFVNMKEMIVDGV